MPEGSLSLERIWPDRAATTPDELIGPAPAGPHVAAVMVSSLDGRAAVAGSSRPLGGPVDLQLLLALRRRSDALLVGPATVRAEGYGPLPCPAVLVSRTLDLPWEAGLFQAPGQRVLVYTHAQTDPPPVAAAVEVVPLVELGAVLADLRGRGLESVLCEGGPRLNRALIADGLLDELFLTLSPLVTADDSQPAIVMGGALPEPARLALRSVATADGELYLRYSV
ncbi:MAG TPA: dihydrofolate reductase family protein [Solirubrobacteraceae bacterium]|nr:dihydrofolate reductase family protein [Solirubrobacteraceae bacterium]